MRNVLETVAHYSSKLCMMTADIAPYMTLTPTAYGPFDTVPPSASDD